MSFNHARRGVAQPRRTNAKRIIPATIETTLAACAFVRPWYRLRKPMERPRIAPSNFHQIPRDPRKHRIRGKYNSVWRVRLYGALPQPPKNPEDHDRNQKLVNGRGMHSTILRPSVFQTDTVAPCRWHDSVRKTHAPGE